MKNIFIAALVMTLVVVTMGFASAEERLSVLQSQPTNIEWRVAELERKVAGMQKQITLLHAKKADKQK